MINMLKGLGRFWNNEANESRDNYFVTVLNKECDGVHEIACRAYVAARDEVMPGKTITLDDIVAKIRKFRSEKHPMAAE